MQIRCYCSPSVQVLDLTTSCHDDDHDDEFDELNNGEDDDKRTWKLQMKWIFKINVSIKVAEITERKIRLFDSIKGYCMMIIRRCQIWRLQKQKIAEEIDNLRGKRFD